MKRITGLSFYWIVRAAVLVLILALPLIVFASEVHVSVVDVTAPTGSVELAPGGSAPIVINVSVSGNQAGTATFEVYRDWILSGGTFTGSNPQEFTVGPQTAGTTTSFSTNGMVTVAAGQAVGTFFLQVGAFNITNTNATGAKLEAGNSSNYQVDVVSPSSPWTIAGFYSPVDMDSVLNSVKGGSTVPLKFRVYDGSGVEQTDTSVVSVTMSAIICPATGEDPISADQLTSGNTSLRYDTTEGQFIYNWKTPKQSNRCYSMEVTAGGESIIAEFKLK